MTIAAIAAFSMAAAPIAGAAKGGEATKPIPSKDREILRRTLAAAVDSMPAAPAPYELLPEESRDAVDQVSAWDGKAKRWIGPGTATAERYYEIPEAAPDSLRELLGPVELTVAVNAWNDIGTLGSEGGAPRLLPIPGAVAIEVSTIVLEEPGGRVAAMSREQAEHRLTELTLAIGGPDFQQFLLARLDAGQPTPLARKPTRRPSQIDFIVVRLHGPKKPVEEFARRIPTAKLRALLHE